MSNAKGAAGAAIVAMNSVDRKYRDENVMAALGSLDDVSLTMTKSVSTIKRRLEELDDTVYELQERLHKEQIENTKTQQELRTRLEVAESKLKKIQLQLD